MFWKRKVEMIQRIRLCCVYQCAWLSAPSWLRSSIEHVLQVASELVRYDTATDLHVKSNYENSEGSIIFGRDLTFTNRVIASRTRRCALTVIGVDFFAKIASAASDR